MAGSVCNDINAVFFVNSHKGDCIKLAKILDVPVENILGLAAQESQYGTGRIAREYNNYFSMHGLPHYKLGIFQRWEIKK